MLQWSRVAWGLALPSPAYAEQGNRSMVAVSRAGWGVSHCSRDPGARLGMATVLQPGAPPPPPPAKFTSEQHMKQGGSAGLV